MEPTLDAQGWRFMPQVKDMQLRVLSVLECCDLRDVVIGGHRTVALFGRPGWSSHSYQSMFLTPVSMFHKQMPPPAK